MSVEASEATVEDSRLLCVAGCGGVNAGSHPTRLLSMMIGEKQKRRWSEVSDDELEQEEKYLLAMVP